jgi:nuclear pore complex protein Nup205
VQSVKPQSDSELQDANAFASRACPVPSAASLLTFDMLIGYSSETKFDLSVRIKERQLRQAIVTYIGSASEFTEPEITVILSPVTAYSRHEERGPRFSGTHSTPPTQVHFHLNSDRF